MHGITTADISIRRPDPIQFCWYCCWCKSSLVHSAEEGVGLCKYISQSRTRSAQQTRPAGTDPPRKCAPQSYVNIFLSQSQPGLQIRPAGLSPYSHRYAILLPVPHHWAYSGLTYLWQIRLAHTYRSAPPANSTNAVILIKNTTITYTSNWTNNVQYIQFFSSITLVHYFVFTHLLPQCLLPPQTTTLSLVKLRYDYFIAISRYLVSTTLDFDTILTKYREFAV